MAFAETHSCMPQKTIKCRIFTLIEFESSGRLPSRLTAHRGGDAVVAQFCIVNIQCLIKAEDYMENIIHESEQIFEQKTCEDSDELFPLTPEQLALVGG